MGTTCASFHALWRGSVGDAAKAISRAYTKLGYEPLKKPPAEGGKQVILLVRAGERYVSVFDHAEDYEPTAYEDMSALNTFRGIHHGLAFGLKDRRLTAQWCRNILRMVAPHMWLCPDLMAPLDRAALERVAVVSAIGGSTKLEKRADCAMDDFELALLPILPIESTRLTIRQS